MDHFESEHITHGATWSDGHGASSRSAGFEEYLGESF